MTFPKAIATRIAATISDSQRTDGTFRGTTAGASPTSKVGEVPAATDFTSDWTGFPIRRRPAGFPTGRRYIGDVPAEDFGPVILALAGHSNDRATTPSCPSSFSPP